MTSESNVNGIGWYLGAFVLGAAAGATVALLTAPRSGSETRKKLKSAAADLEHTMERGTGAIHRAGSKALKAGQAAFEQVTDELKEPRMPSTARSA